MPLPTSSTDKNAACRVVVIDDDPHILEALLQLLRLEGYDVEGHPSASAYLLAVQQAPAGPQLPACVLCDVRMPGVDGLELQTRLSQMDDVGLVLMSGSSGVQEAVQGFRAGAVDFLLKPMDSDQLVDAVARAVAQSNQRRRASGRRQSLATQLAGLTGREAEVMRLVGSGLTNLGIALELGITERTVKFHRQRLLEKLSLSGTADLVRLVQEHKQLGL